MRDNGILGLEDARHRLTGMTAWAGGFVDRGLARPGQAADLMVYDLEALAALPAEIAADVPAGEWRRIQRARGYRFILVNGEVTFEDGRCTRATAGRLLRFGGGR